MGVLFVFILKLLTDSLKNNNKTRLESFRDKEVPWLEVDESESYEKIHFYEQTDTQTLKIAYLIRIGVMIDF